MEGDEDEIRIDGSDASPIAVREAVKEGRKTLEQQANTLADIDDKATRIYRADVLLLSVIIGAMSLASNGSFSYFANLNSITGLLLLVATIALAGITYTSSDLEIGVTRNDIRDVVEDDYDSDDLYFRLASGYADWISENDTVLQKNGDLMIYTIIVEVWALAHLSGGIIVTAVVNVNRYFSSVRVLLGLLCLVLLLWNKIAFLESWTITRYGYAVSAVLIIGLITILGLPALTPMENVSVTVARTWVDFSAGSKRFAVDVSMFLLIALAYPFAGYSIYNLEY